MLLPDDISLLKDKSFSLFFFFLLVALALESPHMFVPPWVDGMLRKVMPCRVGPSDRFKGTPSHYKSGIIHYNIRVNGIIYVTAEMCVLNDIFNYQRTIG